MKSLKEVYKNYFKIGAAVTAWHYGSCKELIASQFDTLTCENEMKYEGVHGENGYDFTKADELYNFAMENGLEMRGHNFIWHNAIPAAKFEQMTPDALKAHITEHIETVGNRYPKLSCWDVINEAIDDKHGAYLRDTVWKNKFGEHYVIDFYALVRKLLPNARLVYNDYNEYYPEKRQNIIRLVNELRAEGVIDAVGLQQHLRTADTTPDMLRYMFEDFAKTGLPLQITELDIGAPDRFDPRSLSELSAKEVEAQAQLYADAFAVYREYSELIESVTFWGVSDEQSWLNYFINRHECTALMFDTNHEPTEAFYRITEF